MRFLISMDLLIFQTLILPVKVGLSLSDEGIAKQASTTISENAISRERLEIDL